MKYFPPFRFDEQAGVLFRDGLPVPLSRKALGLLQCLLATPRAVVTHQRIMESVWSDTHVQPENIKTVVHELRAVLGDRSQSPQFIRSAPGRGYEFVADVTDAMPPLFSDGDGTVGSTLIGRNSEVGILTGHVAMAIEKCEPQLVIVEGERGVGKTALVDAFAYGIRDQVAVRISYANSVEVMGEEERYGVLIDAFALMSRQYPDLVPRAFQQRAPGWLPRFPASCAWASGTAADVPVEERLLRELSCVLDELALDVPLLLLLEDLQWADAGTVECLRHFARGHLPGRVCVVVTYCGSRSLPGAERLDRLGRELAGSRRCSVVRLAPLTEVQLRSSLEERYGVAVGRAIARPLFRAGGGNPLLAVMTMNALVRAGAVYLTSTGWQLASPGGQVDDLVAEGLKDAIQCQIDRLSTDELCLLQVAATIGMEFTVETVAASLGVERAFFIARRLTSLADRHVLIEAIDRSHHGIGFRPTAFRFRHPLTVGLLETESLPGLFPPRQTPARQSSSIRRDS